MEEFFTDPDRQRRVQRFLDSGQNVLGHLLSLEDLQRVLNEVRDITDETRDVINRILKDLTLPGNFIDSYNLGYTIGQNLRRNPELIKVATRFNDLSQVPIVQRDNPLIN